jgi:hypothetical protein
MRKANPIRSVSRLLVIVCLLTSVVAYSFCNIASFRDAKKVVISKKEGTSSPFDTQVPFEEKETGRDGETERDNESENGLFFIRLTGQTTLFSIYEADRYFIYEAPCFRGIAVDIPLYLAKRTFLI